MDNATRAARLAQIFGWEINQSPGEVIGYRTTGRDVFFANILFDDCGGLLPWLLRELNSKERAVEISNVEPENPDWTVSVMINGVEAQCANIDPLLALVDAVIAACAERRAT